MTISEYHSSNTIAHLARASLPALLCTARIPRHRQNNPNSSDTTFSAVSACDTADGSGSGVTVAFSASDSRLSAARNIATAYIAPNQRLTRLSLRLPSRISSCPTAGSRYSKKPLFKTTVDSASPADSRPNACFQGLTREVI